MHIYVVVHLYFLMIRLMNAVSNPATSAGKSLTNIMINSFVPRILHTAKCGQQGDVSIGVCVCVCVCGGKEFCVLEVL